MRIGTRSRYFAAFTLFCLPTFAKADTFQFTPTNPAYSDLTLTFSMPWSASQLEPVLSPTTLSTPDVVSVQIGNYSTLSDIDFYADGNGMKLNSGDDVLDVSSSFFTGTGANLGFMTGSYGASLLNYFPGTGLPEGYLLQGTLTITATPEPSSFCLLGTGLLGSIGFLRRRFL